MEFTKTVHRNDFWTEMKMFTSFKHQLQMNWTISYFDILLAIIGALNWNRIQIDNYRYFDFVATLQTYSLINYYHSKNLICSTMSFISNDLESRFVGKDDQYDKSNFIVIRKLFIKPNEKSISNKSIFKQTPLLLLCLLLKFSEWSEFF